MEGVSESYYLEYMKTCTNTLKNIRDQRKEHRRKNKFWRPIRDHKDIDNVMRSILNKCSEELRNFVDKETNKRCYKFRKDHLFLCKWCQYSRYFEIFASSPDPQKHVYAYLADLVNTLLSVRV